LTVEEETNKLLQEILKQLTEVVKILTPKPVSEELEEIGQNRMLD
jgi:rRNA-processing protein FCF1